MFSKILNVLKPKEDKYLGLLHNHLLIVQEAIVQLGIFAKTDTRAEREKIALQIIEMERKADTLQSQINESVSHALMLPFDRSYMFRILDASDDIIDNIRKSVNQYIMYDMLMDNHEKDTIRIIHESINCLILSVPLLVSIPKNVSRLRELAGSISSLETDADNNRIHAYSKLFEKDSSASIGEGLRDVNVKTLFKRDCIDSLEKIADACEHMGKSISIVVMDNS